MPLSDARRTAFQMLCANPTRGGIRQAADHLVFMEGDPWGEFWMSLPNRRSRSLADLAQEKNLIYPEICSWAASALLCHNLPDTAATSSQLAAVMAAGILNLPLGVVGSWLWTDRIPALMLPAEKILEEVKELGLGTGVLAICSRRVPESVRRLHTAATRFSEMFRVDDLPLMDDMKRRQYQSSYEAGLVVRAYQKLRKLEKASGEQLQLRTDLAPSTVRVAHLRQMSQLIWRNECALRKGLRDFLLDPNRLKDVGGDTP